MSSPRKTRNNKRRRSGASPEAPESRLKLFKLSGEDANSEIEYEDSASHHSDDASASNYSDECASNHSEVNEEFEESPDEEAEDLGPESTSKKATPTRRRSKSKKSQQSVRNTRAPVRRSIKSFGSAPGTPTSRKIAITPRKTTNTSAKKGGCTANSLGASTPASHKSIAKNSEDAPLHGRPADPENIAKESFNSPESGRPADPESTAKNPEVSPHHGRPADPESTAKNAEVSSHHGRAADPESIANQSFDAPEHGQPALESSAQKSKDAPENEQPALERSAQKSKDALENEQPALESSAQKSKDAPENEQPALESSAQKSKDTPEHGQPALESSAQKSKDAPENEQPALESSAKKSEDAPENGRRIIDEDLKLPKAPLTSGCHDGGKTSGALGFDLGQSSQTTESKEDKIRRLEARIRQLEEQAQAIGKRDDEIGRLKSKLEEQVQTSAKKDEKIQQLETKLEDYDRERRLVGERARMRLHQEERSEEHALDGDYDYIQDLQRTIADQYESIDRLIAQVAQLEAQVSKHGMEVAEMRKSGFQQWLENHIGGHENNNWDRLIHDAYGPLNAEIGSLAATFFRGPKRIKMTNGQQRALFDRVTGDLRWEVYLKDEQHKGDFIQAAIWRMLIEVMLARPIQVFHPSAGNLLAHLFTRAHGQFESDDDFAEMDHLNVLRKFVARYAFRMLNKESPQGETWHFNSEKRNTLAEHMADLFDRYADYPAGREKIHLKNEFTTVLSRALELASLMARADAIYVLTPVVKPAENAYGMKVDANMELQNWSFGNVANNTVTLVTNPGLMRIGDVKGSWEPKGSEKQREMHVLQKAVVCK